MHAQGTIHVYIYTDTFIGSMYNYETNPLSLYTVEPLGIIGEQHFGRYGARLLFVGSFVHKLFICMHV